MWYSRLFTIKNTCSRTLSLRLLESRRDSWNLAHVINITIRTIPASKSCRQVVPYWKQPDVAKLKPAPWAKNFNQHWWAIPWSRQASWTSASMTSPSVPFRQTSHTKSPWSYRVAQTLANVYKHILNSIWMTIFQVPKKKINSAPIEFTVLQIAKLIRDSRMMFEKII